MNATATIDRDAVVTEKFIQVDPRLLQDAPWGNIRKTRDPKKNEELRTSMQHRGRLLQPVIARELDDGSYQLLAGYGRRDNALSLEWPTVPCNVVKASDDEALAIMMDENAARENLNPADEAVSAALMVSRYDGDYKLAAEHLGWPVSLIRQRITLRQCIDEVLDALRENLIDVGHAVILAQLPDEKQRQKLPEIVEKKISVKDLKEWSKNQQIPLSYAKFDTKQCDTCQFNSTVQSDLFTSSVTAGLCSKSECFQSKQRDWALARKAELEDEFGTVLTAVEKPESDRVTVSPETVGDEQFKGCRQCSKCVAVMDTRLATIGTVSENQCIDLTCNAEKVAEFNGETSDLIATDATTPASDSATVSGSGTKPAAAKAPATAPAPATARKQASTATHTTPKVLSQYAKLHRETASAVITSSIASDTLVRAMAVVSVMHFMQLGIQSGEWLEELQISDSVKSALGKFDNDGRIQALCLCSVKELSEAQASLTMLALKKGKYGGDGGEQFTHGFHKRVCSHAGMTYSEQFRDDLIATWKPSKDTLGIYTKAALEGLLTSPGINGAVFSEAYEKAKGEKSFSKLMKLKTDDRIEAIIEFKDFDWDGYAPIEYIEKAGLPV